MLSFCSFLQPKHTKSHMHTLYLNKGSSESLSWRLKAKQPWLLILNKVCRKALYQQKEGLTKSSRQPRPQKQQERNFCTLNSSHSLFFLNCKLVCSFSTAISKVSTNFILFFFYFSACSRPIIDVKSNLKSPLVPLNWPFNHSKSISTCTSCQILIKPHSLPFIAILIPTAFGYVFWKITFSYK